MAPTELAEASKVRVIVRVRPFLPHEGSQKTPCVSVLLDQDCDSPQDVTVYLKDKETRSVLFSRDLFLFLSWVLIHCGFSFLFLFSAGKSATDWTRFLAKRTTMSVRSFTQK